MYTSTKPISEIIDHVKKQQEEFDLLTYTLEKERQGIINDLQKCSDAVSDTVSLLSLSETEASEYHPVKPPRECLLDLYTNRQNEFLDPKSLMGTLNGDTTNSDYLDNSYRDYNQNKDGHHYNDPANQPYNANMNGMPTHDGALSSQRTLNNQMSNSQLSQQYEPEDSSYQQDPRYHDDRYAPHESPYQLRRDDYDANVSPRQHSPYSAQPTREEPYSTQPSREDPYSTHPDRDDPYASHPSQEDPYSTHPNRKDPYSAHPTQEDPYASHPDREAPYSSHPVREDPYASHPSRDGQYSSQPSVQDSYANGTPQIDRGDPYAGHPARQEPLYSSTHSPRQEPYSPSAHSPTTDRYDQASDYEPVASISGQIQQQQQQQQQHLDVNPYATGNFDPNGSFEPRNDQYQDDRYRKPELSEVVDLLHHPESVMKLNAAAYLQHLSFMNNVVKQQTGALGGIPALVDLVNHDKPEVQRAACGALRNLSYGSCNDNNKRAIKNSSGIPSLVRLLRVSTNEGIHELITGILWNLSSCKDLKKCIIDDGLTVLVNNVITHYASNMMTTVFRNASGVLRNVSSDGEYARRKLRECDSLVVSLLDVLKRATLSTTTPDSGSSSTIDSKSVENCTCTLRNLSYATQECADKDYHQKKKTDGYNTMPMSQHKNNTKSVKTGCFGLANKKQIKADQNKPMMAYQSEMLRNNPARIHIEVLWQPEVVNVYLPLLDFCTNPETTEAACACLQNLTACDWLPSATIRTVVRKEKGLQIITNLLTLQSDRVIHSAAITLRNLAIDESNKELISQYATVKLCSKLPSSFKSGEFLLSDNCVCAVEAAILQLVQNNPSCASLILEEGTVTRLIEIKTAPANYSPKVIKFAIAILDAMWNCKNLHSDYKRKNFKESDFISKTLTTSRSIKKDSYSTQTTLQRDNLGTLQSNKEREIYYAPSDTNYASQNQAYSMNEINTSKNADYYGTSSTLANRTPTNTNTLNSHAPSTEANQVYAKVNRQGDQTLTPEPHKGHDPSTGTPQQQRNGLTLDADSAPNAADSWV